MIRKQEKKNYSKRFTQTQIIYVAQLFPHEAALSPSSLLVQFYWSPSSSLHFHFTLEFCDIHEFVIGVAHFEIIGWTYPQLDKYIRQIWTLSRNKNLERKRMKRKNSLLNSRDVKFKLCSDAEPQSLKYFFKKIFY